MSPATNCKGLAWVRCGRVQQSDAGSQRRSQLWSVSTVGHSILRLLHARSLVDAVQGLHKASRYHGGEAHANHAELADLNMKMNAQLMNDREIWAHN